MNRALTTVDTACVGANVYMRSLSPSTLSCASGCVFLSLGATPSSPLIQQVVGVPLSLWACLRRPGAHRSTQSSSLFCLDNLIHFSVHTLNWSGGEHLELFYSLRVASALSHHCLTVLRVQDGRYYESTAVAAQPGAEMAANGRLSRNGSIDAAKVCLCLASYKTPMEE